MAAPLKHKVTELTELIQMFATAQSKIVHLHNIRNSVVAAKYSFFLILIPQTLICEFQFLSSELV